MRVVGMMVMKNEANRYLGPCLRWMRPLLDDLFIYDDRSTDGSVEIAKQLNCTVFTRPSHHPSFIEHEGRFRFNAWLEFEYLMKMKQGDWVLAFDADEFIVREGGDEDVRTGLADAIAQAESSRRNSVALKFPEIFKFEDGKAFMRTDGLWGKVVGTRLFAYQQNASWKNKSMGCGSEPTYVIPTQSSKYDAGLHMLHFGYAKSEDRVGKFQRYTSLEHGHGHNDSHIKSIVTKPTLKLWTGPVPSTLLESHE